MPHNPPAPFWDRSPEAAATRGVPCGAKMSSPLWSLVQPSRQACQSLVHHAGPAIGKGPTTSRSSSCRSAPLRTSGVTSSMSRAVLFGPETAKFSDLLALPALGLLLEG